MVTIGMGKCVCRSKIDLNLFLYYIQPRTCLGCFLCCAPTLQHASALSVEPYHFVVFHFCSFSFSFTVITFIFTTVLFRSMYKHTHISIHLGFCCAKCQHIIITVLFCVLWLFVELGSFVDVSKLI